MKRRPKVDWTFMRNGGREVFCERCGDFILIGLPIAVTVLCRKVDGFNLLHADCPPTPSPEKGQP